MKSDAAFKINKGVDRQIQSIQKCIERHGDASCSSYGGIGLDYGSGGRGEATSDSAAGAGPSSSSSSSSGSSSSGSSSSSSGGPTPPATPSAGNEKASSHSETNTQVKGVDEADIVKTDGQNLYILHGRSFKVVKAWPANELAELSSFDIEGQPNEMFVADGKVVVYSNVNGAKILAAAGVPVKAQYRDFYTGGGGDIASSSPSPGAPYPTGGEAYVPLTKITVLTLSGATAAVSREVYFEGGYLDSRRVGAHVRTVLSGGPHGPKLKYGIWDLYPQPQSGPCGGGNCAGAPDAPKSETQNPYPKTGTEMIQALERLRSDNLAAIAASQLSDWLPYTFVKTGDAVAAHTVACEDFYVPTAGSTESGLTEIASIDLADPAAAPRESAILGRADTVYGSADTIYLAAHAWVEPPFSWIDDGDGGGSIGSSSSGGSAGSTEPSPPPPADPGTSGKSLRPRTTPLQPPVVARWTTNRTHVHKFEFATDARFPNYVASGTVAGNVKDQFSLDDKDGFLRIATTENRIYIDADGRYVSPSFGNGDSAQPDRAAMVNRVFVLGKNGPWLDVVGDVGDLAPNERIYSTRFVEGRGYVVTFRQVDPLFVLDLSVPQKPVVLAALKIPGFSEYMHPLGANHILTIGKDASEQGRALGLQLQIFDVTNGANPVLKHKFTYSGSEYGHSEAEHDHKAFTYFADRGLLAFPYYAYVPTETDGMRSSLELFRVETESGFAKVGSIDHSSLMSKNPTGYCNGYFQPSVRRGVFLENFVYSISYGGIVVKDANNLAAPGSQLALPSPTTNEGYGPVCY